MRFTPGSTLVATGATSQFFLLFCESFHEPSILCLSFMSF